MREIAKENENYYPDRSYKNSAKNGTIKTVVRSTKIKKRDAGSLSKIKETIDEQKQGKSYINTLLSTRWTSRGAEIVITRQPDTTDEAYALAKKLQAEMTEELVKHNRFIDDYDDFLVWFAKKEEILKDNGFHKKKG